MKEFDLDQPLIDFSSGWETGHWTVRHAVEGVQIFGGIGSGKTSGSGRMLALKYLAAGFGGLVLTVKPDEKEAWREYCSLTGRLNDLIVIEPGGPHTFNFLEYEAEQARLQGKEAFTENIVQVLKTVIHASQEKDTGRQDDAFWESALDMLMFNVIDLCKLAYGTVSVQRIFDIAQSIPKSHKEMQIQLDAGKLNAFHKAFILARQIIQAKIEAWTAPISKTELDLLEDDAVFEAALLEAVPETRTLKSLDQFFFGNFINVSEKTRAIIDFTFCGFLFRLLREPVYSLFCQYSSSVIPEDSLGGKIILLNLPVKLYDKVGRDCQLLYKYIWQRAMERRNVKENARPVFLWADEAQNFLHEHDASYQATARSSRISTVYITQNLPNYFASMGGDKSEHRIKGFLGTLATKIFHANADSDTNNYASELIGDTFFEDRSSSSTYGHDFSHTRGQSLKLERLVRPEEFISLKTGGPTNDYRVEGYFHRQGDTIRKGRNHTKMAFNQNFSI